LEEITAVQTKRLVLAQINVCNGCCCGKVEKKRPEVPLDWLKSEWKSRGLLKRVQLSISGCLGPCDVANVVMITSSQGTQWLGGLNCQRHYDLLIDWAERSKNEDRLQPLPLELQRHAVVTYREQQVLAFASV
jgi:hypothetical protein